MKKQIFLRSLILFILSVMFFPGINSQSIIPVTGRGQSVDKKVNVSDFKGIDVSSGFDVILVQGSSESLTLTIQENLFEYVTAKVESGTLKIYTRNNLRTTQPMKARITFKDINSLRVSGGGDIYGETPVNAEELEVNISGGGDFISVINSENLKYNISGGGDTEIGGKAEDYSVNVSGGGDIKSKVNSARISFRIGGGGNLYLRSETRVSSADLDISGGGDVDMQMNAEKLRCSVGGGGDALLSGKATEFDLNINGGGDADAMNLSTETATFRAGGGSDVHLKVSKELSGTISGGGDLYYSGNPSKVSVDARGGSEVHKE
jgi:hypothetical protein